MTLAERRELQRIARAKQESTPVNKSDKTISLKVNPETPVTAQPITPQTKSDAILNKKRELQAAQEEKELVLKDAASSPGSTLLREQAARKIANQQQYDKDFMSNYRAPSKVLPSIPAPAIKPATATSPVAAKPRILTVADINRNAEQAKAEVAELIKKRNAPAVVGTTSKVTVADINRNGDENKTIAEKSGISIKTQANIDKNNKRLEVLNNLTPDLLTPENNAEIKKLNADIATDKKVSCR